MNRIFFALLFCLGLGASALADGRAFPPDDCSPTVPFMAFNGVDTNGNTYCINGQSVLSNALSGCGPGQIVAFNGTQFYCADNALNPPTCAPGEFVTADGTSFHCAQTETPTVPTCPPGEVLTGSGGQLACVAQAGGGATGDWCGLAWRDATFYTCEGTNNYASTATCKGSSVVSSCPSGYTSQSIQLGFGITGGEYSRCLRTCIKN